IDYADLRRALEGARGGARRRVALRLARVTASWVVLAVLPFVLLIRGGVLAYRAWGLGTWPSLALAALATATLLGLYAGWASRRFGAGPASRQLIARGVFGVALAYVAYMLVFIASANVKSDEVRAEYRSLHPLLRVASSALILADPAAIVTDAGRSPQDYRRMGLSPVEASLHFVQDDGYVHALDLRTNGRSELRNRSIQAAFWMLGFHTLRHVGTDDHLHVSLRLPG
ncbi:MAG TPA: hypothetical protein VMM35_10995, partial [Longimicrobiales bacterium]|nr:hypothetical protein [Longimicrobiales bacterium]